MLVMKHAGTWEPFYDHAMASIAGYTPSIDLIFVVCVVKICVRKRDDTFCGTSTCYKPLGIIALLKFFCNEDIFISYIASYEFDVATCCFSFPLSFVLRHTFPFLKLCICHRL